MSQVKEAIFILTHPVEAVKTKRRQLFVAIEHEAPPHTSTFEEFPELPISEASEAIKAAELSKNKS